MQPALAHLAELTSQQMLHPAQPPVAYCPLQRYLEAQFPAHKGFMPNYPVACITPGTLPSESVTSKSEVRLHSKGVCFKVGASTSKKALEGVWHVLWRLRQGVLGSGGCLASSLLGVLSLGRSTCVCILFLVALCRGHIGASQCNAQLCAGIMLRFLSPAASRITVNATLVHHYN